mmetsp:Transcript_43291/g.97133  ORF Transcript_43291/g.97133 Transcript_43291/m.97133 type:complete len:229 (+) Transcript_43291:180-866(+)
MLRRMKPFRNLFVVPFVWHQFFFASLALLAGRSSLVSASTALRAFSALVCAVFRFFWAAWSFFCSCSTSTSAASRSAWATLLAFSATAFLWAATSSADGGWLTVASNSVRTPAQSPKSSAQKLCPESPVTYLTSPARIRATMSLATTSASALAGWSRPSAWIFFATASSLFLKSGNTSSQGKEQSAMTPCWQMPSITPQIMTSWPTGSFTFSTSANASLCFEYRGYRT